MQIVTHVLTSPQSELRADTEEASARRKAARQNIGAVAGIKTESGPIEPDSEGYVQIPEVVDADENTKGIVKLTNDPTSEAANTAASPAAIRTALANFGGFKVVTLDPETEEPAVPLEERSTKYIYLTKDSESHETDPYTEWIWVVEEAPVEPHWDIIGTTSVDLSGYAQKTFVESFIASNYDPTKTVYYQGELCIYEDKCYRAKNIIVNNGSAIGAFDSSKWAETNFADSRLQILNYYVNYEWPSTEVTNKAIQSGSLVGLRYITPASPQYYEKENTMYWLHSYSMDNAGNLSATFLNTEPTIYAEPEYVEYNSITYSIIKYTSSGNEHWTKENGLRCPFYTYDDQYKLSGIAEGAQVNVIESVKVAGSALEIVNKSVNVPEAGGTTGAWVKGVVSGEDKTRWDSWESAVFPIIPKPNIVVIGGRTYPTVKIGNQMWMAENLDYKWDGLTFPKALGEVASQGACYYNNDEATYGVNGNKYGLLYNWYAAKYLNDNRATLLPDGWHVATSSDFTTLFNSVESVDELRSVSGWSQGNGTNDSGFNAYPSGYAVYAFQLIGIEAFIACSDQANNQWGWYAQLTKTTKTVNLMEKWDAMSIRLVKNLA